MGNKFQQMTDEQLTLAVGVGELAAFDEIVRRYCQPLTMFAAGRAGSVHNAEDIIQETFLRAFQNMDSFNTVYFLKNWLFTITYRLIVSEYRKKRPRRLSDKSAAQLADSQPGGEEHQWVWQVARGLKPEAFTVLWLRYKQEMTTSEIADVMKKTKIMVRVLLHRARKRLARRIADKPEIAEESKLIRDRAVFLERTE